MTVKLFRVYFVIFWFCCGLFHVYGKDDFNRQGPNLIESSIGASRLMKSYTYLYSEPFFFAELRAAKQTYGNRSWQREFGYPEVGLSMEFGYLGKEDYGYAFGLVPDITFNTLSDKILSVKVRFGLGLAYFSKPYDINNNTENTYIGSKLANMSLAAFTFQYKCSKKLYLHYGLNYYHCSNGHYQVPNEGMNLPGFKLGLKYYPEEKQKIITEIKESGAGKSWNWVLSTGMGVHEFAGTLSPVGGPKYGINTYDFYVVKRKCYPLNIRIGLTLKHYHDYGIEAVKNGFFENESYWNAAVLSSFIGNEFLMYKTGVFIQTGMDLYAPFEKEYLSFRKKEVDFRKYMEEFVSSKIGINYYFFDPLSKSCTIPFFGVFIKTNLAMADFIGCHIGFEF